MPQTGTADIAGMVQEAVVSPESGLWNLQAAVEAAGAAPIAPPNPSSPARPESASNTRSTPIPGHHLQLREVSQFPPEQVRRAFRILSQEFPEAWKEQVR